jgi:hypothetical protein
MVGEMIDFVITFVKGHGKLIIDFVTLLLGVLAFRT